MRKSLPFVLAFAAVLVSACSDSSPTVPGLTPFNGGTANLVCPTGTSLTPSQQIDKMICDYFPKGLETATGTRWENIKSKLGTFSGTSWSGDVSVARSQFKELAKFITGKARDIDPLALGAGETQPAAAGRLVLAMFTYFNSGPLASPPTLPPAGEDVAVSFVPAGEAALVQTPTKKAGLRLDAGSTGEDRLIVISQTPEGGEGGFGRCQGPLPTDRCQFGPFYKFESFPHLALSKSGRFAVCHVKGALGPTEAEDGYIRLAHNLPADPNDYTPGASQEGGIEILPKAGDNTGVVDCTATTTVATGIRGAGMRALFVVAGFAGRLLAPKDLYAYDQGPEHFSDAFSDFNAVSLRAAEYSSFSAASTGIVTVASAQLLAGALQLTPANTYQKGAAWSTSPRHFGHGFDATFTFSMTETEPTVEGSIAGGADGLAFVLRGNGSDDIAGKNAEDALTGTGGHMGYMGISPVFAIEFDTWNNGTGSERGQTYYDSDDNHIAIRAQSSTGSPFEIAVGSTAELSGAVHTGRIRYASGVLTVYLDGVQVGAPQTVALPAGLLDGLGTARVGFTAGTGAAIAKHQILSWTLTAPIQ